MSEKNRNLLLRVVSAIVLLPIVLYLLYRGGYYSAALLGFAAAACAREYLLITMKELNPLGWGTVLSAGAMPLIVAWRPTEATALISGATGVVLFAGWLWHLLNGPLQEGPQRTAQILTAFIYGHGGLTALMAIRNLDEGVWWVVAALVITWGNDTAAYFFGRFLGKHKLYPEVSPSKSWEGFFGGFVGAIGFMFVQRQFFAPFLTITDCIFLGVCGSLLGPAGDLCESMLKRAYGVKDSGNIIPGHGGMLDRIDALIFNAPMVLLYVQFMRPNMG
ncbi:MAG: phosphatidate cytidylyltransferase [Myxococcales bacterium]|nr:phosphatidate cytidylyltransferase [Myxococcales bacterium]MDP3503732.1 phosphatidate cytidylyltransferase [Myxococcales bacterium]